MEHLEDLVKVWPVIVAFVTFIIAWCDFKAEIKGLKEDIGRLEHKQDKYNHLQERTIITEVGLKDVKKAVEEIKERVHEYHH